MKGQMLQKNDEHKDINSHTHTYVPGNHSHKYVQKKRKFQSQINKLKTKNQGSWVINPIPKKGSTLESQNDQRSNLYL